MKIPKTFPKGGVHPDDRKESTNQYPIKNASLPSTAVIPMSQHVGKPAELQVQKGDKIREGMLIGTAQGFVSVPVHSSIPGQVTDITNIILPNGNQTQAAIIELEGQFDRLGKQHEPREWNNMTAQQLLDAISAKGLVGMGGATFPTHVKFTVPKGKNIRYVIINGAECEPYLTSDHRLMVEKSDELLEGIRIIQKILEPEAVYIGIEENKPDAIETLEDAVRRHNSDCKVVPLHMKYPQGDEKQLVKAIIGAEVPSGGLPLDVDTVLSNVGTVFGIYEAVVLDKPLIERVVTVTGGAVREPANLKIRVGTKVRDVIEECGGFAEKPEKVILGGPMMGLPVYDLDTPVTKSTSGILALTKREAKVYTRTPCIQCGRCVRSCPMGLHPTGLFKSIDHSQYSEAVENGLYDCRECGCCEFTCPAQIPLVQGMKLGKRMAKIMEGNS